MIASLSGKVVSVDASGLVVEVGGVGYLVQVPASVSARLRIGEEVSVLTQMIVREDSMTLYGFESADQREVFRALTSISGVGPKIALAVLSSLGPESLRGAVAEGDVDLLSTVPGVGRRSAQRMLVELKDTLGASRMQPRGASLAQVREALLSLGYTAAELRGVIEGLEEKDAPVEEQVRAALKELARA